MNPMNTNTVPPDPAAQAAPATEAAAPPKPSAPVIGRVQCGVCGQYINVSDDNLLKPPAPNV